PTCLGLPGALPVPNKKAVEWTIMLGLALGCEIAETSKFDRKNYFYPDLPKGYQISQYDQPIARDGWLDIYVPVMLNSFQHPNEIPKQVRDDRTLDKERIRINRVHLEEDTGKLIHGTVNGPTSPSGLRGTSQRVTLVDFNRSGVPLVEIVTEPDLRDAEEARIFLKKLHQIIRYLDISDADMEKGSMRLEPNISVKKMSNAKLQMSNEVGELPPYKVEVKNINSFNFVKKAIEYETLRQGEILERGETPLQETRGWEEKSGITLPQRRKEEANDYRYFPEPDIPPMEFTKLQIQNLKSQIPEMPAAKLTRFINDYGLPAQDAQRLTDEPDVAEFFEECIKYQKSQPLADVKFKEITPKMIANWILNKKVDIQQINPEKLLAQIQLAKTKVLMDEKELSVVIKKILNANPPAVADYKKGKIGVMMFFVGQVLRELKGRGDAAMIKSQLEEELKK
ncbi:MAG: Asp-tRNA(Asn)/Glu-tRNA(Gln) amidotransferase subunit GatB, partial [Patescibacteria group bacterium]